jgi:hypothetical protein
MLCCPDESQDFQNLISKPYDQKQFLSRGNTHCRRMFQFKKSLHGYGVVDGTIKVAGPTSHLFYEGEVMNHNFKNFEIKAQIKTMPGANSGLYFHTEFQENGFPDKGFEVQVNNSHTDWKRTAGLYDIVDTREVYVKDSVWFTMSIRVEGKHVVTKINDKTIVDWTEPGGAAAPKGHTGRVISSGTFAIQAHDPKSIVFFRDILVKPLP